MPSTVEFAPLAGVTVLNQRTTTQPHPARSPAPILGFATHNLTLVPLWILLIGEHEAPLVFLYVCTVHRVEYSKSSPSHLYARPNTQPCSSMCGGEGSLPLLCAAQ